MKFQRYLNEKYFGTMRTFSGYNSGDYDIFINPSKKEIKEAIGDSAGYRYTIDFKNKKVYVFSANAVHADLFNVIDELPTYFMYWNGDRTHSFIFTGAVEKGNAHYSDALAIYAGDDLRALLEQDWKWVNKYLDVKAIRKMIEGRARIT